MDFHHGSIHIIHQYKSGGKCGMTAQINLTTGGKPAQFVTLSLLNGKGCFGKIILSRYRLHEFVLQPFFHYTDSSRISFKQLISKSVNYILFHNKASLFLYLFKIRNYFNLTENTKRKL